MGKPTGFLEFVRQHESYDPVSERLQHYREPQHAPRGRVAWIAAYRSATTVARSIT